MQKGKYGICMWFYALIGFVLAILGQLVPCMLLLGFVIAAERDEWAIKQVMQALFLCLGSAVIKFIPGAIQSVLSGMYMFNGFFSVLYYVFNVVLFFAVVALSVVGIVNALRGSCAGVPVLSKLADRAFGLIERKAEYRPPEKSE